MNVNDPLSVVQRMVAAINAHDVASQVRWFHPRYESRLPAHPSENFKGSDQVRRNWTALIEAVPDLRADIEGHAVNGPEVWIELHVHGRREDGTAFDVRGVTITTVVRGRITAGRIFLESVDTDGATIDTAISEWVAGDSPAPQER